MYLIIVCWLLSSVSLLSMDEYHSSGFADDDIAEIDIEQIPNDDPSLQLFNAVLHDFQDAETIKKLCENGADPAGILDETGSSCLHYAFAEKCSSSNDEQLRCLIQSIKDTSLWDENLDGKKPLDYFEPLGKHSSINEMVLEKCKEIAQQDVFKLQCTFWLQDALYETRSEIKNRWLEKLVAQKPPLDHESMEHNNGLHDIFSSNSKLDEWLILEDLFSYDQTGWQKSNSDDITPLDLFKPGEKHVEIAYAVIKSLTQRPHQIQDPQAVFDSLFQETLQACPFRPMHLGCIKLLVDKIDTKCNMPMLQSLLTCKSAHSFTRYKEVEEYNQCDKPIIVQLTEAVSPLLQKSLHVGHLNEMDTFCGITCFDPFNKHQSIKHLILNILKQSESYSNIQKMSAEGLLRILNKKDSFIDFNKIKKELFIIDGPLINIKNDNGDTILHLLMQYPQPSLQYITEKLITDQEPALKKNVTYIKKTGTNLEHLKTYLLKAPECKKSEHHHALIEIMDYKAARVHAQELMNYKDMLLLILSATPTNAWYEKNNQGKTPLDYFNSETHGTYKHFIIQSIPSQVRLPFINESVKSNMLMQLLQNNNLEEAAIYLSLNLDGQELINENGDTVFHIFLQNCSIDDSSIRAYYNSILSYKTVAELLLKKYPDLWNKRNKENKTPCMFYKPNAKDPSPAIQSQVHIPKELVLCAQERQHYTHFFMQESIKLQKKIEQFLAGSAHKKNRLSTQGNHGTLNSDI